MIAWLVLSVSSAWAGPVHIVNGEVAPQGAWPEVVSLVDVAGTQPRSFCSGTLIDDQVVLTAAHCVDELDPEVQLAIATGVDVETAPLDVVLGTETRLHPSWLGVTGIGSDVALVFLERPPLGAFTAALNDGTLHDAWLHTEVDLVGYGVTTDNGEDGGLQREGASRVSDIRPLEFEVAGGPSQVCFGDSGGPTFVDLGGGRVQLGVHSYVSNGCVDGTAWDARVDTVLDWITEQGVQYTTAPAGPPDFSCSHAFHDPRSALGVVPFELKCLVEAPDPDTVRSVTWTWGDGEISNGFASSHVYTDSGTFPVTMCAELEGESEPFTWCLSGLQKVTACGMPEVSFTTHRGDEPLDLVVDNHTDVSTYGCITDAEWRVYAGTTTTGEPLQTKAAWSPLLELPKPGTYTIALSVGGYGGTNTAVTTVTVGQPIGCTTGGGSAGWTALLPLLFLVRRRR